MSRVDRDLADEIAAHLAEAEEAHIARGLSPEDAKYAALRDFGGVTQVKQVHREMRIPMFMNWLDIKLGGRMLVKYPGLTIVGGLAMAFAILVGIVIFQFAGVFLYPSLPLPNGERIVALGLHDVAENEDEPQALFDFLSWKASLRTVDNLGAARDAMRTLITEDGDARPAFVAEMSASGFTVAGGRPLMGRMLTPDDEQPAASAVAVIGHGLWSTRFGGDPDVIGRTVQLGADHPTIVGVMREGFAFPVSHEMWVPLKTAGLEQAPRSGPAITVFGTLADGQTLETANAELTTNGRRLAVEQKLTHEHLEPRVVKYADMMAMNGSEEMSFMFLIYFFIVTLVVLICGNVGLLLFARAASRESDLIVRTALGASRARIVSQLFAEALVLGGLAAIVGVVAADLFLRHWAMTFLGANYGRLPFWWDLSLSPATGVAAIVLTVLAATVAGVMPALRITRGMSDRLKQSTAGAGGLRFGGVWTVVIVAQVAVTVVFPAIVWFEHVQVGRMQHFNPGFATEQFLAVAVERDSPEGDISLVDAAIARDPRMAATLEEMRHRAAAQAGVAGVTFADALPGGELPERRIELGYDDAEAVARAPEAPMPLRQATVVEMDTSYLDVLDAPIIAGRKFSAADAEPGAQVAIVDQAFVDNLLQGRNPIGQEVRFTRPGNPAGPGQWYTVIGLVGNLDVGVPYRKGPFAGFYLPTTPERLGAGLHMMIRVRGGDPMSVAPQVRQIATAVDPSVRLVQMQRLDEANDGMLWVLRLWMTVTAVMSSVALLLSLAGLYAVMSFTVARRTREIGVRVALGGSRPRILAAIFRRPLMQMSLGVLAGMSVIVVLTALYPYSDGPGAGEAEGLSATAITMQAGYAAVMLGVCLLACVVPTRRALNVEPTVALRTE
ncbi:MAG: ABC transporter permease [Acidobacteria bacterium]|nr:ABC transporter permease [Acidobacteriota bacterium]